MKGTPEQEHVEGTLQDTELVSATDESVACLAPPQQPDEIGRLGTYRILKVLGEGGMGIVFKAQDVHLQRHVALKVMRPTMAASKIAAQRFMREAQAMAALKHDHVVTIYQVGEEEGVVFLAMEFLEGEPLDARLLRETMLPLREVVRIGREIAHGLGAAHKKGLIHRDIKPANLWLEAPAGRVKILDFGLARAFRESATVTQAGTFVGTPAYVSPEQVHGENVGPRSDLFSVGCVLYELTTGHRPFKGATAMAILMSVTNSMPPSVVSLNARVPLPLHSLIMSLLAKDPDERPQSADELAERLEQLQRGGQPRSPSLTQPLDPTMRGDEDKTELLSATSAPTQRARTTKKSSGRIPPLVAILLLGIFAAVAVAGYFYAEDALRFVKGEGQLTLATKRTDVELLIKDAATGSTVVKTFEKQLTLKAGEYEVEVKVRAILDVAQFKKTIKIPRGGAVTLDIDEELAQLNAPDPRQEELGIKAVRGEKPIQHNGIVSSIAFDPKDEFLASGGHDQQVKLSNPRTGALILEFRAHDRSVTCIAVSRPDGKYLATGSEDKTVKIWDLREDGGALRNAPIMLHELKGCTKTVMKVAFSPEGNHVACCSLDKTVRSWDVVTGRAVSEIKYLEAPVHCACYSPDGRTLAAGSGDGKIKVWNEISGTEALSPDGHDAPVCSITFSPDGRRLASASLDETVRVWDVRTGRQTLVLQGKKKQYFSVRFSPDGRWLATGTAANQMVQIWDASTGFDIVFLRQAGHVVRFSPDGKLLAAGNNDHTVKRWNVAPLLTYRR